MASIKVVSALKMSIGFCSEKTRNNNATIPFVKIASLSAVNFILSVSNSEYNQTLDWQPFIRFSSNLYWSEIIGKDLPSSIIYS